MPNTIEQIADSAVKPPSKDRKDTPALTEIDKLWLAVAKRRRDEVREGKVETIDGDEALRRVRNSIRR